MKIHYEVFVPYSISKCPEAIFFHFGTCFISVKKTSELYIDALFPRIIFIPKKPFQTTTFYWPSLQKPFLPKSWRWVQRRRRASSGWDWRPASWWALRPPACRGVCLHSGPTASLVRPRSISSKFHFQKHNEPLCEKLYGIFENF